MSNSASPNKTSAGKPAGAPALKLADLPPQVLAELRNECKLSDEDIAEVFTAVQQGVRTPGEMLGITPGVANTVESMALTLYRHRHYSFAASMYGFLLEMDANRGSAWRGLGACNQATKTYAVAVFCYQNALEAATDDIVSRVLLGETLCLMKYPHLGVEVLQGALAMGTQVAAHQPYLKRAEGILKAQNVEVAPAAAAKEQAALAAEKPQAAAEVLPDRKFSKQEKDAMAALADRFAQGGDDRAIFDDPQMKELMAKLSFGLDREIITLKQVAGFTDEQMYGGYVAACRYLDMGQPLMCLHIVGWLLYLDTRNAKYYQLAGISAQHLKLWCFADYLYGLSLIYDDDENPSPITQIYRGEAKIFSEERHAGVELLRTGMARCGNDPEEQDAAKRAKLLLTQFGSKHERSSNRKQP